MRINLRLSKKEITKIFVEINAFTRLGEIIKNNLATSKIVVVTNKTIKNLYGTIAADSLINAGFEVFFVEVEEGESYKNFDTINLILENLLCLKLSRDDTVLALGGGVIGDMAGFAASIYLRGINLVQVPTTLLSMVDSSIGGKTGVNHEAGKNLIGSFYQPKITVIDPRVLLSLPQREIRSGLAEVVKYGFIMDLALLEFLAGNANLVYKNNVYTKDLGVWLKLIKASAKDKVYVVAKDEREQNLRAILNFGHTIGHAIEAAFKYVTYTHGEAVALGMKASFLIAFKMNLITENYFNEANNLLENLGFDLVLKECDPEQIVNHLFSDKKIKNDKLRFVLPVAKSVVEIRDDVPLELIREALAALFRMRG